MDDRNIEEMLRRSWQPEPPEGMRERVLRRSRQEIARRSGKRPIWGFVRPGPVFAAIALAIVLLANVSDYYRQGRLCAMTQCADAGAIPGDLLRQRRDMEKLLVQGISEHWAAEEGGERL